MSPSRLCSGGQHRLKPIYRHGSNEDQTVVRWCSVCGAVVVDTDYDGRTNPGAVREMEFPAIALEAVESR